MSSHQQNREGVKRTPGESRPLTELLDGVEYTYREVNHGSINCIIERVSADSRQSDKGGLFVALPGSVTDGHHHIEDAAGRGCIAIIAQKGRSVTLPKGWAGVVVEVEDSRDAYARIAENYYLNPAQRMQMVGITGTNGKTTITYLVEDVLVSLGYRVGVIGTINYRYTCGDKKVVKPSPFTTPEAMQLQGLLSEMAEAGVEKVLMEVSSHALIQQRIGHLQYDVAAFTNLSRDHLDYHRTMEEYFEAKSLLFTRHLVSSGRAVISSPQQPEGEVNWSSRIEEYCQGVGCEVITTGKAESAGIRLIDYQSTLADTSLRLRVDNTEHTVKTPLVGHYNVDNLLTALGILLALGNSVEQVLEQLGGSKGAPGRLERVSVAGSSDKGHPVVFVDYAHTPDALRQVLATLAGLPHRDLFCVFGCGGDRDGGKRPVMGTFAATFSTVVLVTDDNPRTEDPDKVRSQIIPGVVKTGLAQRDVQWLGVREEGKRGFIEIGDRSSAIEQAIKAAGEGDIVLIAGKGHENYQLGITGKRFFDDCLEARCALLGWTPESVAKATGGKLYFEKGAKSALGNVSTDSRTIGVGDIFVALIGENFDAHNFLDDVAGKNAGCLVVSAAAKVSWPVGVPRVEVADTLKALGDLAQYRRRAVAREQVQQAIAITGSCGKTTVKEMTAAIMRRVFPAGPDNPEDAVLATKGNLNNLIGLPLTLLPITPRQKVAILEMGMNAPGEIAAMARTAEPDICCITNVHGVHLEGLGDIDGVARAKGELFAEAGPGSTLIVNLDDEKICQLVNEDVRKKITFSGEKPEADIYAQEIIASGESIKFTLVYGNESATVNLQTVGLHNVSNALAAAAIGMAAGASLEQVVTGLEDFRPADRRMVRLQTREGVGVINDTYNANPASMEAGLRTLVGMKGGKTLALLGDMLELGEASMDAHKQLGSQVAKFGVNFLGVVGRFQKEVHQSALESGMVAECVRSFATKDDAAAWAEELIKTGEIAAGGWILVKASRSLRMETIVERLTGKT